MSGATECGTLANLVFLVDLQRLLTRMWSISLATVPILLYYVLRCGLEHWYQEPEIHSLWDLAKPWRRRQFSLLESAPEPWGLIKISYPAWSHPITAMKSPRTIWKFHWGQLYATDAFGVEQLHIEVANIGWSIHSNKRPNACFSLCHYMLHNWSI